MIGQLRRGPLFSAAMLCTGLLYTGLPGSTGATAAEAETYRIIGVDEGQMAHMRARPASRSRPVGYIPADARGVTLAGHCSGDWCQVHYQDKTGWVSRSLLKREAAEAGEEIPAHVNSSPAPDDAAKLGAEDLSRGRLSPEVPAPDAGQTQGVAPAPEPPQAEASPQPKSYVIAGVASGSMLELREAPADGAKVIGSVPHDASELEFLGQSARKWRQIRYRGESGWILGRHLAEAGAPGQRFRAAGVSMMESVAVREYPDAEAGAVGALPSYASGIVAIGACDAAWCHIRYLGLVGWVERRYLEPLAERRS